MSTEEPSALAFTRVAIRHGDNTSPTVARALVEMYDRAKARADAADLRANAAEENARRANANVAANVKNAAQAEAKIAAVRELHRPVPVYTTEAGDCEHGDDCESVEISAGSYCPVHTDGLTCDSCAAIGEDLSAGELPAYPCPTIAALDGTA